jgi:hypothetical protein
VAQGEGPEFKPQYRKKKKSVRASSRHPSSSPPPTLSQPASPHLKLGTPTQQTPHCSPAGLGWRDSGSFPRPAGLLTNSASHSRWQAWKAAAIAEPWSHHLPLRL